MPNPKKKARKPKAPRPPKPEEKKPVYTTINGTPIIQGKAG
jgi:hypothetical protein